MEKYKEIAETYLQYKRLWDLRWSIKEEDPEKNNLISKFDKASKAWHSLPDRYFRMFSSADRTGGGRLAYSDLTLRNICGNLEDDYKTNEWSYIESHSDASWKGPLHWLPRKQEINRFVQVAEAVSPTQPRILEIGAGSGLLSFLLAQTDRLQVVAMDPNAEGLLLEDNKYNTSPPYNHPRLELLPGNSKASVLAFRQNPPDLIVSSWMPEDINFTQDVVKLHPKAIIYIYDLDYEYKQVMKEDMRYSTRFTPKKGYRRAFSWQNVGMNEVLKWWQFVNSERDNKKELLVTEEKPEFFNDGVIEIHLRDDIADFPINDSDSSEKYLWENPNISQVIYPDAYSNFVRNPEKLQILTTSLDRLLKVDQVRSFPKAE